MAKRLAASDICDIHNRARTVAVGSKWYCPRCVLEDEEARRAEEAETEA